MRASNRRTLPFVFCIPLFIAAAPIMPGAEDGARAKRELEKISIPDVQLLNQDGQSVRFYSDLVKGKVVAINFMFTRCINVCPIQAEGISKVLNRMADRLGKDFRFISISVDPEADTPARLKTWAESFHIRSDWTLVTGPKPEIGKLLTALGAFAEYEQILKSGVLGNFSIQKGDHSRMVLVGNDPQGLWMRGPVNQLAELMEEVISTHRQE
jgi:protein SCO1